ncbi:hypothetical protein CMUS01_00632 [Colletotrichum musicola]|uniref:Uncharacterized protein n=1 Tax=Colletotrichum musicola TaxID=2175873 RepID=A0A8H6NYM6_9PEZI|nr:hypothetical protein CMUS01_00632 [Colletotrichum musicola]
MTSSEATRNRPGKAARGRASPSLRHSTALPEMTHKQRQTLRPVHLIHETIQPLKSHKATLDTRAIVEGIVGLTLRRDLPAEFALEKWRMGMPRPRRDDKTIPQQETFLSKPRILVGEASAQARTQAQKIAMATLGS